MSSFPFDKPRREKAFYFQIHNLKTKILHIFIKRRKFVITDTAKAEKKLTIEIYKRFTNLQFMLIC